MTNKEIDQLVYGLYRMTEEEIGAVEGENWRTLDEIKRS